MSIARTLVGLYPQKETKKHRWHVVAQSYAVSADVDGRTAAYSFEDESTVKITDREIEIIEKIHGSLRASILPSLNGLERTRIRIFIVTGKDTRLLFWILVYGAMILAPMFVYKS